MNTKATTPTEVTEEPVVPGQETKSWVLETQEDPATGDMILTFPPDLLEKANLKEGDVLNFQDNKDGSFTLSKKETELVMVECVSTFRIRYMVEVPIGKADWSLDTVTLEEAKEFSQKHLGEQIVSHRVVSPEEAIKLCDEDNAYCSEWTAEKKEEVFFTPYVG
jgi:bifunctional DNA-binding transcriptional regulator/antitoxin component of YhaV-PrlF toxin-antitoxin module